MQEVTYGKATRHGTTPHGKSRHRAAHWVSVANRRPLPRGLVMCYLATWCIPPDVHLLLGSMQITPTRVVGAILFFLILIRNQVRWNWVDLTAILFLLVSFLTRAQGGHFMAALESTGKDVLDLVVAYCIGRYAAANVPNAIWLLKRCLVVLAILAIFIAIESIFRLNIHSLVWNVPYRPHKEMRYGMTRAHGFTTHAVMLGLVYAGFVPLALTLALEKKNRYRLGSWMIVIGILSGVFFSLSAGGWVAAGIGIMLLMWDRLVPLKPSQRWGGLGLLLVIGYLTIKMITDNPVLMVLMYRAQFISTGWLYRWQLWERVMSVMPGHWWLGYGFDLPPEFTGSIGWSVDNHYLVLLLGNGYLGLWSWILFQASVILYAARGLWMKGDKDLHRIGKAIGFAVAAIFVAAISVFLFSVAANLIWLLSGLSVGFVQAVNVSVRSQAKRLGRRPRSAASGMPTTSMPVSSRGFANIARPAQGGGESR